MEPSMCTIVFIKSALNHVCGMVCSDTNHPGNAVSKSVRRSAGMALSLFHNPVFEIGQSRNLCLTM